MPSLTTRFPDLQRIGPVVEALIGPSSILKEALQKEKKEIH